jgi:2-amino-4-hydroxy-6-hydroxymethyldihydropteridine diphosphokinase
MGTLALIGLGSNLGDRKAILDSALSALGRSQGVCLRAASSYHETKPVGGPPRQGAFLNAAAAIETSLGPFELLALLQEIEQQSGRLRLVHWGERTLDLDLLLFGNACFDRPDLSIPHPRMSLRRFVLAPLAEIAPDAFDAWTGRSIRDLLSNLDRRPSYLALYGGDASLMRAVCERVCSELDAVCFSKEQAIGRTSSSNPGKLSLVEVQSLSGHLDPSSCSMHGIGDRWIVSDFCFPFEAMLQRQTNSRPRGAGEPDGDSAGSEGTDTPRDLFETLVSRALPPTFAVALTGFRQRPLVIADTLPVPHLYPEAIDFEGFVSEILATCAATRS